MSRNKSHTGLKTIVRSGVLVLILLLGVYASFLRFFYGLGATTNLSDGLPWGLWIWLNLTRIAISSGGFIFCAGYFIFHWESLKPMVRPAVLIAFTGYFLVGIGLIFDLGLPQHFWHPLLMWNLHSPMFEVSWCLMLYGGVLAIELGIPITEGLGWKTLTNLLHKFCALLSGAGVILSVLHQSSFGTLFLIAPEKMHPFWYSSWLPYLFLFSAGIGGISFLTLQLFQAERARRTIFSEKIINIMTRFLSVALWLYLGLFLMDFVRSEKWSYFLQGSYLNAWFVLEVLFIIILPLVILHLSWFSNSRVRLCLSSFLAFIGIALNRFNVVLLSFLVKNNTSYFPSWQEFAIAIFLFTLSVFLITMVSRFFPIFSEN